MKRRKLLLSIPFAVSCILGTATAAAQEIQERNIKFGHLNAVDHPIAVGARKFIEIATAKSGGKFKIREFPGSQLGSELQQQSALQGGSQEMFVPATTSVVGIVKEFGLFDFPFTLATPQQADALVDGPFGKAMLDKLPEKGLVGLAYWENGFRNMTNSKRPISKVEDLAGLKIRVIPNPVFIESFKALKMNPVPLAFGELYTALETKTVDAQENPYAVLYAAGFFEVQKYVSNTNHVYSPLVVLVSKKFWDKLAPAEQKILQDAAIEARDFQRQYSRTQAAKTIEDLKAKGMAVNDVPPAERERMRQVVLPVTQKFSAAYDPASVKLFNSELERIRK